MRTPGSLLLGIALALAFALGTVQGTVDAAPYQAAWPPITPVWTLSAEPAADGTPEPSKSVGGGSPAGQVHLSGDGTR
jgi:hypothetical protein